MCDSSWLGPIFVWNIVWDNSSRCGLLSSRELIKNLKRHTSEYECTHSDSFVRNTVLNIVSDALVLH